MVSLTFGLFTQVSGSGPLGPLVYQANREISEKKNSETAHKTLFCCCFFEPKNSGLHYEG